MSKPKFNETFLNVDGVKKVRRDYYPEPLKFTEKGHKEIVPPGYMRVSVSGVGTCIQKKSEIVDAQKPAKEGLK